MEDTLWRKVRHVGQYCIEFEDGTLLLSEHELDCCELHFLDFRNLTIEDFNGLEFNLYEDNFFKKINGYGIELMPNKGNPVRIPGKGYNNGHHPSNLSLVILGFNERQYPTKTIYDITKCQTIELFYDET